MFAPILANAQLAARVALEGKCRGILFDVEQLAIDAREFMVVNGLGSSL